MLRCAVTLAISHESAALCLSDELHHHNDERGHEPAAHDDGEKERYAAIERAGNATTMSAAHSAIFDEWFHGSKQTAMAPLSIDGTVRMTRIGCSDMLYFAGLLIKVGD